MKVDLRAYVFDRDVAVEHHDVAEPPQARLPQR